MNGLSQYYTRKRRAVSTVREVASIYGSSVWQERHNIGVPNQTTARWFRSFRTMDSSPLRTGVFKDFQIGTRSKNLKSVGVKVRMDRKREVRPINRGRFDRNRSVCISHNEACTQVSGCRSKTPSSSLGNMHKTSPVRQSKPPTPSYRNSAILIRTCTKEEGTEAFLTPWDDRNFSESVPSPLALGNRKCL